MITANVAGSSGSHVRRHRDSDSYSSSDLEEIERKYGDGGEEEQEEERRAREEEAKRIRQLIMEHRRKKFLKDYKTWAYLLCVAVIVIGAIVLIVLTAMGVISDQQNKR